MIKLTDATGHYRDSIWINPDHIQYLHGQSTQTTIRIFGIDRDNDENLVFVKESPEVVVAAIERYCAGR